MNILVTGGSSGLGKNIVELLAVDKSKHIYFTYNRHREMAEEILNRFGNLSAIQCDFTHMSDVQMMSERISNIDLDVLVNNAYVGMPQGTHFHKTNYEDFLIGFEHNIIPTIRLSQAALMVFKKRRFGKIINVLTEALIGLPPIGYSIYSANKAYLQQLSKVWNKEYARYNISVNNILPAYMETNLVDIDERVKEHLLDKHPLKKLLSPNEVASLIEFLINASQQFNGINIPINAAQKI